MVKSKIQKLEDYSIEELEAEWRRRLDIKEKEKQNNQFDRIDRYLASDHAAVNQPWKVRVELDVVIYAKDKSCAKLATQSSILSHNALCFSNYEIQVSDFDKEKDADKKPFVPLYYTEEPFYTACAMRFQYKATVGNIEEHRKILQEKARMGEVIPLSLGEPLC